MNRFLLLLLPLWIIGSCSEHSAISGVIEMKDASEWARQVYLIRPRSLDEVAASFAGELIDSVTIESDGSFSFHSLPENDHAAIYELVLQKKGEKFLTRLENEDVLLGNYMPIVYSSGENLVVKASAKSFQKSLVLENPSPDNKALIQLRHIRLSAYQQWKEFSHAAEHNPEQLLEEEAAHLAYQQSMVDFAENTDFFLPAMVALRWVSPNNDYERIPEFLVNQCEKWSATGTSHSWLPQLCQKANKEKLPVLTGDMMPNLELPISIGGMDSLMNILGEKMTILDIWASWCAPCRKENRDILVPLWDNYHQDGLQIIAYGLESEEGAWMNAIKKDGADRWLHSAHLQGDESPLMESLKIQTIPANFILDHSGKILAKNLHGEELVTFIEEYF